MFVLLFHVRELSPHPLLSAGGIRVVQPFFSYYVFYLLMVGKPVLAPGILLTHNVCDSPIYSMHFI